LVSVPSSKVQKPSSPGGLDPKERDDEIWNAIMKRTESYAGYKFISPYTFGFNQAIAPLADRSTNTR